MIVAQAGQIIADRYRLEEPLGHGAMGKIWRAEHLGLSSKVALKFLDQTIADTPETFNRFMLEAQSAALVRSSHVVQILDCGVDGAVPYISMELLHGESLDKRLRARRTLPATELDKIMREVALAVDNAHAHGVVHRDLKPANIFIARERDREITKVLDFGIAKLVRVEPDRDSAALTSSGILLGTPHYMSPEQARGSRSLDHRTDLWSLAIVAYECMTGELPFQGGSMGDIFIQICKEEPPLPSELVDVPPGFDEWFRKGTSKKPDERFASAAEMAESLSLILSEAPVPTVPGGRRDRSPSDAATLRSEPGMSEEAPRSSSPMTHTATVWLPRSPSRWLFVGALAALACSAIAIAVWPEPPKLDASRISDVPLPAVGAAPSVSEATRETLAVHELTPTPPAPAPSANAPTAEPNAKPKAPRKASPPIRRELPSPAQPAAPVAPRLNPPTSITPERDDLEIFSERH